MGTPNGPATSVDLDQIAETRRQIKELTEAWNWRHLWRRLRKDGPPGSRAATGD